MGPTRRRLFLASMGLPAAGFLSRAGAAGDVDPGVAPLSRAPLRFPADHAAHPGTRIEWWYVTGYLSLEAQGAVGAAGAASWRYGPRGASAGASDAAGGSAGAARGDSSRDAAPATVDFGFQLTFFRSRTGLAASSTSRFAPRQLVFAHAALTDLGHAGAPPRLSHDQRIAREGFGLATTPAPPDRPLAVSLGDWSLARESLGVEAGEDDAAARLSLAVRTEAFALSLVLDRTQPLLRQGDAGWSRKGPGPEEASRYYSEPQLAVSGTLERSGADSHGAPRAVRGRAWLDHEWSQQLMSPEAVGWDWIGINLVDGGALTAFQLRRADGSASWAGGSWRAAGARASRAFAPEEVRMSPGRTWRSAATEGRYPVEWTIATPAGRHVLRALLDDQELDSRGSTGSVYWEGLAELLDEGGRRVGLGYLEMTGRAGRLRL